MSRKSITAVGAIAAAAASGICIAGDEPLADKTLVAWAAPANLDQRGGSIITVNDTVVDRFDGIVFGEIEPRVWMPGSNSFERTNHDQAAWPKETAGPDEFVQMAIVYKGSEITVYRNGDVYACYETDGAPWSFSDHRTAIVLGQRHLSDGVDYYAGRIRDARVYAAALDREALAALEPGKSPDDIPLYAWWDFSQTATYERTGRFREIRLGGDARLESGCLVLDGDKPRLVAAVPPAASETTVPAPPAWSKDDPVPTAAVQSAQVLREKLLDDPWRPRYHFAVPEGMGRPGDANACFYANGRYHLMYLYNREGVGFCFGHLSSRDLVHWRYHPDAIGPGGGDEGCFSGGAFVDDDGTAWISFWMLWGDKGVGLARAYGPHYDNWEKFEANPVIPCTEWGVCDTVDAEGNKVAYGVADPTNIWKKDGRYYMCTGNLLALNKYGREENSPAEFRGDHLSLFESDDLVTWTWKGDFYERRTDGSWTDDSEDNMCPSFLPLPAGADGSVPSDKHLLLFISHNMGCQFYVGTYDVDADRFVPESHGRMTWIDNTYFAPEALIDDKGRQIMWAWLTDNPEGEPEKGWSGVFGLPRTLWVGEDGTLRMAPVPELEALRYHERQWEDIVLSNGETRRLQGVAGDACELEVHVVPGASAGKFGLKVRASENGEEETLLYVDATAKTLCFDARQSGVDGRQVLEQAPFELRDGEPLRLRVFVDASVVEVYANDRQAICRRVYPGREDSLGVLLFAEGGSATFSRVVAWEMMPSNPY